MVAVLLCVATMHVCSCAEPPAQRSVQRDMQAQAGPQTPAPAAPRTFVYDAAAFARALSPLLAPDTLDAKAVLWSCRYADTLRRYYRQRDLRARWCDQGADAPKAQDVFALLGASEEHGIPGERYHVPALRKLFAQWHAAYARDSVSDDGALARIDLLMTDAVLAYARDMKFGVTDPKLVFGEDFGQRVRSRSSYDMFTPLRQDDAAAWLRSLAPRDARYTRLQDALRTMRAVAQLRQPDPIPVITGKVKPGDSSSVIPFVRARLRAETVLTAVPALSAGFFPDVQRLLVLGDSVRVAHRQGVRERLYDARLAYDVSRFQARHGLPADSVLGARTIAMLNASVTDRIQTLSLNLDRFRWMSLPDSGRYVRVNIPEFYVYAVENGQTQARIKVCVGMRNKVVVHGHAAMNYQTPIISGDLSYIILNPVWSVPPSIAVRETYYQALKDPTYLVKNNYRVYRNDTLVNPATINWKSYNPNKLPFRFVQGAGERNALGRIKFTFYNPFDVYLHDTPKRLPFRLATRTVSHGCVRVEEPKALLRFLLQGHKSWTPAKVDEYLAATQAGKAIPLEHRVPIHLDYVTSWVDDAGMLQIREDVYGKDALLRKAWLDATRAYSRHPLAPPSPAIAAPAKSAPKPSQMPSAKTATPAGKPGMPAKSVAPAGKPGMPAKSVTNTGVRPGPVPTAVVKTQTVPGGAAVKTAPPAPKSAVTTSAPRTGVTTPQPAAPAKKTFTE